ncbi:unnamed protein product [Rotaria sp. Silwood2]|nr:unnamed protein product [Rotaria sp. Silwood2]CAF2820787.1 unnamed protein product [Rotaria sp. Silwood2]CAF3876937.1 unnamed protein product [Rotaria sp. Silwood2]CAF3890329.1 unnamed protein product [Rotaria sp. Silwood2]
METVLGRGYSINEEFGITDFYSPPSSVIDQDEEQEDDLFYHQDENNEVELTNNLILSSSPVNEIADTNSKDWLKPLPLKLMSIETTPPPTPLMPRRLLDPINNTTTAFQNMTINTNLPITPTKFTDINTPNWSLNTTSISPLFSCTKMNTPKTTTNLLTPTNMDRYLIEHRHLSDSIYKSSKTLGTTTNTHQSISVQHTEVNNETSRLYSYMDHVDGLSSNVRTVCTTSSNSWSAIDDTHSIPSQISINKNSFVPPINMKPPPCLNNSLFPQRINSLFPNSNGSFNHSSSFPHQQQQYQSHDPWILSEMSTIVRQNQQNTNILLSTTAQQILAANTMNNNRPLRSEKIDIEVIKHLIREANWKRQCGMKKEVCVFCRNNGENELIYSSHSLKDSIGNVTCPILRAYQCPICGATGSQAHTIKYCQATGDDNNRHVLTPYEKMLRMQTFGFDDNVTSSMPGLLSHIGSPTSLYTNGWSDSYL